MVNHQKMAVSPMTRKTTTVIFLAMAGNLPSVGKRDLNCVELGRKRSYIAYLVPNDIAPASQTSGGKVCDVRPTNVPEGSPC